MIRQRGMSSLLMVLLLLTLGSLLLEGLNLQQRALLAQTASETQTGLTSEVEQRVTGYNL
ncbi:hypothetical protein ACYA39_10525 [Klebsiella pneumoniae]|uniref:hypothetical protein n=1 Tax=Klebsiella pneumoniae TaxID=573 RepID=UPI0007CCF6C6|nr:hypothetical protein [Klebsiella pneumoniae]ELZ7672891.1 hypothetical protein [Klebsiella pneumoniae]EME6050545.1 hypothetical protein [Klebsiella pneumoniae]MBC4412398.1 hypothetical protein [Klebsiella pneumoniae]MBD7608967.1 hypothetical protein [Klebsiella pneumoniae]